MMRQVPGEAARLDALRRLAGVDAAFRRRAVAAIDDFEAALDAAVDIGVGDDPAALRQAAEALMRVVARVLVATSEEL